MPYKCTACDKSFRYKVSQRTHKCTAQPPGMVIRQAGDLIQKLIKQNAMTSTISAAAAAAATPTTAPSTLQSNAVNGDSKSFSVIDASNAISVDSIDAIHGPFGLDNKTATTLKGSHRDHFLDADQTLDEFVEESYKRLGFANTIETSTNVHQTASEAFMTALDEIQIPSPSERLQNLCLYSPSPIAAPIMAIPLVTAPPPPTSSPILNENSAVLSPANDDLFAQTLETINEDTFKQLLYGNIDDLNSLI